MKHQCHLSGAVLATLLGLTVPAAAQSPGVLPGSWEIAVTINTMTMQGAPPGIAQMMIGKTTRVKHCLTPADAARGPQDLLKTGKSCVFTRYTMSGGNLNSEISCKQGSGTLTTVTTGKFTSAGFTATGHSTSTGAMPMTMTSTSVGRRLGDC